MTTNLSTQPSTSTSLLVRAGAGDNDAWQKLVRLYGPLVYQWSRRAGLQRTDAADVTQEVFIAVARQLQRFEPAATGTTFRGWLWTITRNKAVDLMRRQARQPSSIPQPDAYAGRDPWNEDEPPSSADDDRRTVLHRALHLLRQRFEPQTWTAFWRTTVDGCTPEAVAEELGMNRWSVYKARARVLQLLRQELAGLEEV